MSQKTVNSLLFILLLSNLGLTGCLVFTLNKKEFEVPGKGLDHYDMSSPEAALNSIRDMVTSYDIKAGIDFLKLNLKEESNPFMNFLTVPDAKLSVEKTHVIKDSSKEGANGTILAYIKVVSNGVETRDVRAFQKKEGILVPGLFTLYEFNKDSWTQEDKYLWQLQNTWKTKARLD